MPWVRTATLLISFGFTIYKAFEYLRQRQPDVAHGVLGPRNSALVLIGLGIGALVLATVQHRGGVPRLGHRSVATRHVERLDYPPALMKRAEVER
jgi:putative membrane protein